jgi:hypothetical protein
VPNLSQLSLEWGGGFEGGGWAEGGRACLFTWHVSPHLKSGRPSGFGSTIFRNDISLYVTGGHSGVDFAVGGLFSQFEEKPNVVICMGTYVITSVGSLSNYVK